MPKTLTAKKEKNKFLGQMCKIRVSEKYPDPDEGKIGKVVCVVKEGQRKIYIVQFSNNWGFFRKELLKIKK